MDTNFSQHPDFTPNLLPPDEGSPKAPVRKARHLRKNIFSCFLIALILIITSCTTIIARSNNNFFVGVKNGFIMRQLTHLFTGVNNDLKGERDDRINFLLMGIGGPGHEGPYLTDTMILASFKPSTKEVAMLSIPRDLIVRNGSGNYIKVNHIYALAQKDGIEKAFAVTKEAIARTFGVDIHYMGVVDFQGFKEVIDAVGGVNVDVERDFTDYQFPVSESRTQAVSFKKGTQKMDGLTALVYARSRHGNNGEGSDFARSKRQQKIILATKEKLASFNTLFNPHKLTTLFGLINDYTKTDIEPWEVVKLVQMGKDIPKENFYTTVLDDSSGGYLYSGISSIDSAYILQPIGGSYAELQALVQNFFKDNGMRKEAASVMLQNGTTIPNIASTVAASLEKVGIKPVAVGNAKRQGILHTQLYDYSDGKKPVTRKFLESRLGVTAETNIPLELLSYTLSRQWSIKDESGAYRNLDFLIILGQDIQSSKQLELIRTLTPEELKARASSTDLFATSTDSLATSTAGFTGEVIPF